MDRRSRDRPEQPTGIRVDARIEVVDLGREVFEVILTSVEVQSDECERAFVDRSVNTHVYPTHEAHVGVEEQRFRGTVRIGRSSGALDFGHAHEAVEVIDRRRINPGAEEREVERLSADRDGVNRWLRRCVEWFCGQCRAR